MSNKIIFDEVMQESLLKGVETVSRAVTRTMGPHGQLVMFEDLSGVYPVVTKDGVSVASMITLDDKAENMGAQFVIQGCRKQVEETGDGTTLTALLTYKLYNLGLDLIRKYPFRNVVKEYESFCDRVVGELKSRAIKIENVDQLKHIARVSINGDIALADKIAEAVYSVGKHGIVSYDRNHVEGHEVEYEKGYRLEFGIQYKEFCTDGASLKMENPYVLVTDRRITDANHLQHVLSTLPEKDQINLIIVAPAIGNDLLQVMMRNIVNNTGIRIVHIRPCDSFEPKKNRFILEDIAAATGARFVSEDSGIYVQNMSVDMLGKCGYVMSNPKQTFFHGLNDSTITKRMEILEAWPADDYETRPFIDESMAKLTCGLAVVKIGSKNFTETMELMARVDDAIRACKSAQEMGYVRGGGVELVLIERSMLEDKYSVNLVLYEPIRCIISNSHATVDERENLISCIGEESCLGYDIDNMDIWNDMYDHGIIDPVKVLVYAFRNATSIAISMLKTSAMIIEEGKKT